MSAEVMGSDKYLAFLAGSNLYGIAIMSVKEIIGLMPIFALPTDQEAIRGGIRLRGRVIPVVDIRRHFGLQVTEDTEHTCIIVLELQRTMVGLLVDEVEEVICVKEKEIVTTPNSETEGFQIGTTKDGLTLLDVERLFPPEMLTAIAHTPE